MDDDRGTASESKRPLAEPKAEVREPAGTPGERPELSVEQILAWADAHHAAHGAWPEVGLHSGLEPVDGVPGESWKAINYALAMGLRGLPGDSSLAELLAEHRGLPGLDMGPRALAEKIRAWELEQFPIKGLRMRLSKAPYTPPLSITGILAWADAYRATNGAWPTSHSGPVRDARFDVTWATVNSALAAGRRGLPGGSSLLRLLDEHREPQRREPARRVAHVGVEHRETEDRSRVAQDALTVDAILEWADAHHAATGEWPSFRSGLVRNAPGRLGWETINVSLIVGYRGLPGGTTLGRLLAERRGGPTETTQTPLTGARAHWVTRPPLTVEQILEWADAHHATCGRWPTIRCGCVAAAPEETWRGLNRALVEGRRGLPGGTSLATLLQEQRGRCKDPAHSRFTLDQVLGWADAHFAAHGCWPGDGSGPVAPAPDVTWRAINQMLHRGHRGLPGGTSLARVLHQQRGHSIRTDEPRLTLDQILAWADDHFAVHGRWPTNKGGPVATSSEVTWRSVDNALLRGHRGLSGRMSLARVLAQHRGQRNRSSLPRLTVEEILAWADAHFAIHGRWPDTTSGPIAAAPQETWGAISVVLTKGHRGLPGGVSLARLLAQHRGRRDRSALPGLTIDQILAWADAHFAAHGRWPTNTCGSVGAAPEETWRNLDTALAKGSRGLSGRTTLARLLTQHRGRRNRSFPPRLTVEEILAWADAHFAVHGRWPNTMSGPVAAAPEDTWRAINRLLAEGRRGLPGGTSLAQLLVQHRGHRNTSSPPRLTVDQILAWADAHSAVHGRWPNAKSGPVAAAPEESWNAIDGVLTRGNRGLSGGTSLAQLLAQHRGYRNKSSVPRLTVDQILAWADAHFAVHSRWPTKKCGSVSASPQETWGALDNALAKGSRGLSGRTTLRRLLAAHRPPPGCS